MHTHTCTFQAFNFSFLLSTSQSTVKVTDRWRAELSCCMGGFGAVCDEGYGVSYIVANEDEGLSAHTHTHTHTQTHTLHGSMGGRREDSL